MLSKYIVMYVDLKKKKCFLNFEMITDLLNLSVPIQFFAVFCVRSCNGPALRFSVRSATVQ